MLIILIVLIILMLVYANSAIWCASGLQDWDVFLLPLLTCTSGSFGIGPNPGCVPKNMHLVLVILRLGSFLVINLGVCNKCVIMTWKSSSLLLETKVRLAITCIYARLRYQVTMWLKKQWIQESTQGTPRLIFSGSYRTPFTYFWPNQMSRDGWPLLIGLYNRLRGNKLA